MPLYEYQCNACGHRFEVIQKFSDAPVEACEKCGGAVGKLLSSPAIQFKGSGWYITDYARAGKSDSKSDGGAAAGKTEGAGSGESATDSKTETKTATKTETKSESGAPASTPSS